MQSHSDLATIPTTCDSLREIRSLLPQFLAQLDEEEEWEDSAPRDEPLSDNGRQSGRAGQGR